jgi:hypothetical protein
MPQLDANADTLRCYRCGDSLAAIALPLRRLELCPGCGVELHVCRMCRHFAPSLPDACDEDDAVVVRDKAAANFCDFFVPATGAFDGRELRAGAAAEQQLKALFGEPAAPGVSGVDPDSDLEAAEKLFRK